MQQAADHIPADKITERVCQQHPRYQQHDIAYHNRIQMPAKTGKTDKDT